MLLYFQIENNSFTYTAAVVEYYPIRNISWSNVDRLNFTVQDYIRIINEVKEVSKTLLKKILGFDQFGNWNYILQLVICMKKMVNSVLFIRLSSLIWLNMRFLFTFMFRQ